MELIVETHGVLGSKHQGRLRVMREKEKLQEVPLVMLEQVLIASNGVAVTSDVVRVCSENGIPIHFVNGDGRSYGTLYSRGVTGTSRRAVPSWRPRPTSVERPLLTLLSVANWKTRSTCCGLWPRIDAKAIPTASRKYNASSAKFVTLSWLPRLLPARHATRSGCSSWLPKVVEQNAIGLACAASCSPILTGPDARPRGPPIPPMPH